MWDVTRLKYEVEKEKRRDLSYYEYEGISGVGFVTFDYDRKWLFTTKSHDLSAGSRKAECSSLYSLLTRAG